MVRPSFPTSRPLARPPGAQRPRRPGFTILELLVVVAIIVILSAFVLVGLHQVTAVSTGTTCLNNLSRIHDAFVNYAGDNQGLLPSPATSHVSWEQSLKPYLPDPRAFQCPSDQELFSTLGSSYDWRDAGLATTSLAGVNLSRASPTLVLCFDSLPGWHASNQMNAVLVNGSASPMSQNDCLQNLQLPINAK